MSKSSIDIFFIIIGLITPSPNTFCNMYDIADFLYSTSKDECFSAILILPQSQIYPFFLSTTLNKLNLDQCMLSYRSNSVI